MSHKFLTSPPQVLDLPSKLVGQTTQALFLDEFHIVVSPDGWGHGAELTVFNTLVLQDHPENLQ